MTRKTQTTAGQSGTDRMGRTALHYAAADSDLSQVEALLPTTTDINARDKRGFTALHFATQSNSLAVSEVLLRAGAQVDASDDNGNTPLSNAVFSSNGQGELIKLLLAAGANPNKENNAGVSPVGLADSIANFDLVQFFA